MVCLVSHVRLIGFLSTALLSSETFVLPVTPSLVYVFYLLLVLFRRLIEILLVFFVKWKQFTEITFSRCPIQGTLCFLHCLHSLLDPSLPISFLVD
jgi:hypothetical protein